MKLYKKDSKGKIRELEIYVEDDHLIQVSGLLDGKKTSHRRRCRPKNINKANATTGNEQAIKEKESKIAEKLRTGYFKTVLEAQNNIVLLPMLAKEYSKEERKIDWATAYVQPKMDGMRCLAVFKNNTVKLYSRDNVEITTLDHITLELMTKYEEGLILDGELYCHGEDFQTNMSMIKAYKQGVTEKIKYYVYDMIADVPFMARYEKIRQFVGKSELTNLVLVPTSRIPGSEYLDSAHQLFLKEGYEGTMIRWGIKHYETNARSSNLLKYKDFKDIACTIVDIGPAKKRPNWGRPIVEWEGKRFACSTAMTVEQREDLLTNKDEYIGLTAEIRYFELSNKGIPRFPVMHGIRLDK